MSKHSELIDPHYSLLLSDAQIDLILEHAVMLEDELEDCLRKAPEKGSKRAVQLTVNSLDDLEGHVAAAANHCADQKIQGKLDTVLRQIDNLQQKCSTG